MTPAALVRLGPEAGPLPRLPMRTLGLLLALAAAPAAQTVHAVPFGATGNALELELAGAEEELAGARVAVAGAPPWLRFGGDGVADDARVARLAFDVDRTAPVGVPAEVVLEVWAGQAVVATHVVRLSVSAPTALALGAPFPNPSRGGVSVAYEVPSAGPVRLAVVDALGREVAVLAEGERAAGAHHARMSAGPLAAGVYVVRLVAGGEARARPVVVVR